ncbi:MAG: BlaI/MecI/CopY family transcriptional regulator [Acidobacteriota bacterium]|nr:BlaI/MecI/CopY family transcriptional regulator [Acidobacteriota bacterium]
MTHTRGSRARLYTAAVPREQIERDEIRRLIDRSFGGRAVDLIAHLLTATDFDENELPRLRALLWRRPGASPATRQ